MIRVSNSSDPDQERHSVGPDLSPTVRKVVSRPQMSPLAKKELIH